MNSLSESLLEEIKSKILTSIEYSSKEEADKELEYHFEIKEGEKAIHYFGAFHGSNPEDSKFVRIKEEMDTFKPDIVYVEGIKSLKKQTPEMLREIQAEPIENFIRDGENWYTAKLAIDKDIPVKCPEPDFEDEIQYISKKGFSNKDIFDYYIFRVVYQYQTHFKKQPNFGLDDFKKYVEPYLERLKKTIGWSENVFTNLENEFWKSLRLVDEYLYAYQSDPIPWKGKKETKVNEVARESSLFRDRYIVERLAYGLLKYNRLFIVYGSAHAVKQEPALTLLIKKF